MKRLSSSELSQIKQHVGRSFNIGLPGIAKPSHCCTINNTVVSRPANIHNMSGTHGSILVESGKFLPQKQMTSVVDSRSIKACLIISLSSTKLEQSCSEIDIKHSDFLQYHFCKTALHVLASYRRSVKLVPIY